MFVEREGLADFRSVLVRFWWVPAYARRRPWHGLLIHAVITI